MKTTHTENNFDAIRLIAALMVVFAHSFQLTHKTYENEPLHMLTGHLNFGNLGVSIFLFISGFLISNSLRKSPPFPVFFKRRILRMIPALAILVIITVFIIGPAVTSLPWKKYFSDPGTYSYFRNIFLFRPSYNLPGVFEHCPEQYLVNGSLWTLAYEFTFYVGVFVLLFFVKNDRWIITLGLVMVATSTFSILYFEKKFITHQYNVPFIHLNLYYTLNLFNYFIAGVIFRSLNINQKYINHLLFISIGLVAISSFKILLINKLIFYIIVPCATFAVAFHKKINLTALIRRGDYSYGIYLYSFVIQQTLIYLMDRPEYNPYLFFLLSAAISYAAGFLSWHLVESRFLKIK